jgi:diguanylate cyclase (GGDEF)-like protein/PAS domain S-box-containing protein
MEVVMPQGDPVVRESDERYRLLVETSPDGIILTDLDGTILIANAAAARLHGGRSGDELLGSSVLDLVNAEDRAHVQEIMKEALHVGYIQNTECRLRRGNDSMIAELAISAVTDEAGSPTGFVHVARDVTRQKQREEQLKDQMLHDPLTGLPNRVLFHDRLGQAIESARRSKTQVGVLYIDLDHFKGVNDRFGHDSADVLLQQTARRMQQTVRASDTLGRLGGDEFAAVLPNADAAGATVTASKLKDEFGTSFELGGTRIVIGASIGIAVYPLHGEDAMTVLHRADVAMYAAKRSGRRNVIWHPSHEDMLERERFPTRASDALSAHVDPRVLRLAHAHRRITTPR